MATIYTLDQIEKHNTKTDCWVIIHNKVYNITEFSVEVRRFCWMRLARTLPSLLRISVTLTKPVRSWPSITLVTSKSLHTRLVKPSMVSRLVNFLSRKRRDLRCVLSCLPLLSSLLWFTSLSSFPRNIKKKKKRGFIMFEGIVRQLTTSFFYIYLSSLYHFSFLSFTSIFYFFTLIDYRRPIKIYICTNSNNNEFNRVKRSPPPSPPPPLPKKKPKKKKERGSPIQPKNLYPIYIYIYTNNIPDESNTHSTPLYIQRHTTGRQRTNRPIHKKYMDSQNYLGGEFLFIFYFFVPFLLDTLVCDTPLLLVGWLVGLYYIFHSYWLWI